MRHSLLRTGAREISVWVFGVLHASWRRVPYVVHVAVDVIEQRSPWTLFANLRSLLVLIESDLRVSGYRVWCKHLPPGTRGGGAERRTTSGAAVAAPEHQQSNSFLILHSTDAGWCIQIRRPPDY